MRLADLAPAFLRTSGPQSFRSHVPREDADGIVFDCPKCSGTPRSHAIVCWEPSVEPGRVPGPGRWTMVGETFDELSLLAASSSVQITTGCKAHFWVRDGEIVDC